MPSTVHRAGEEEQERTGAQSPLQPRSKEKSPAARPRDKADPRSPTALPLDTKIS